MYAREAKDYYQKFTQVILPSLYMKGGTSMKAESREPGAMLEMSQTAQKIYKGLGHDSKESW